MRALRLFFFSPSAAGALDVLAVFLATLVGAGALAGALEAVEVLDGGAATMAKVLVLDEEGDWQYTGRRWCVAPGYIPPETRVVVFGTRRHVASFVDVQTLFRPLHHVGIKGSVHISNVPHIRPSSRHLPLLYQPNQYRIMSGKGGKAKSGGKASGDSAPKSQSRSAKAGLQFPVGRVHRLLKKGNYAQRIGSGAPGESCNPVFFRPITHSIQSVPRCRP